MIPFAGEIISLVVAVSWTATAIFADIASHRLGATQLNMIRMALSLFFLAGLLWVVTGTPYPAYADGTVWLWLALSGLVGYVFGDFCLFNSYVIFGSKYGQLLMTLAPIFAGISGWVALGESMGWTSWLAMIVTITGIGIAIMAKGEDGKGFTLKLPLKGVLFGIGAAIGQGVGLVLSKIGLEHYEAIVPQGEMGFALPFAGTFIRAIAGLTGFFLILLLGRKISTVGVAMKDRKGMVFALLTTFFGPFLGVSLSLMAVQYAKAGIASTLMALTPVLIIVPYSIINRQRISVQEILGTVVTLCGVGMFFLL